ncbi:hypothetical protein C8F01DRAFT_1133628 [Mycena amicta]|nr:hypothetical protein C8F01DRAFT_1133628 [Mycena amicta]
MSVDTLTRRIRAVFESLSFHPSQSAGQPPDDGRPIPPADAVQIRDPELISLLSDPAVMNGVDGRRQSVWSMLEEYSPHLDTGSDRSSVMFYSPLLPTNDSLIELADTENAPVVQHQQSWLGSFLPLIWPFTSWTASMSTEPDATPRPSPTVLSLETSSLVSSPQSPAMRQVWVPSTTKLSFETMWWGYRIYLPPPVLEVLDDQSIGAARQATILTSALTWFFSNLPISAFPPPLQPAMLLLQRLVPFVSYLGTFISWSWGTIRSFDKGHGVILTATWLFPPAVVPGTWHARDFPPPSAPVSPAASFTPLLIFSPQSHSLPLVLEEEIEERTPTPPAPKLLSVPLPHTPEPEEPSGPLTPPPSSSSTPKTKTKSRIKTIRRKLTRALSEHGLA